MQKTPLLSPKHPPQSKGSDINPPTALLPAEEHEQRFRLFSPFSPTGDQPQAIEALTAGVEAGLEHQVLLGVTGSGKTYTVANVIERTQKPTLVISHNKTLAAQLFQEFREFFPENKVEYFVSYYDYYQPEAYVPQRDLYIEKESNINDEIDKLRLSATTSLITHKDVIVVASVSCIYNLGSPREYATSILDITRGMQAHPHDLMLILSKLHYTRNDISLARSTYRLRGDTLDIHLAYEDTALKVEFLGNQIRSLSLWDPLTGDTREKVERFAIFPAKHYITQEDTRAGALEQMGADLAQRLEELKKEGKTMEAYRLEQRTRYDMEMIKEVGYCTGIENYSRYFDGRAVGDKPFTLLDFFQDQFGSDFLCVIDESHMTIPQMRGMYAGDRSRKETLVNYGFRLPSALDNRPLMFSEILPALPQLIHISATPNEWEVKEALKSAKQTKAAPHRGIVEQLVRPTGIIDPIIDIRPCEGQVSNLLTEIETTITRGERVLVTTLTKRTAEDLAGYLEDRGIKGAYLHSDVDTLARVEILEKLRRGEFDVLVGINLLREGLDLPEVSLVAILDADKEGFLRSTTALIQTMGRAARHVEGRVIMYADRITDSMKGAIEEGKRRRIIQEAFNKKHHITPSSISKKIRERMIDAVEDIEESIEQGNPLLAQLTELLPQQKKRLIAELRRDMLQAAKEMDFERAATIRDQIKAVERDAGITKEEPASGRQTMPRMRKATLKR